MSDVLSERLWQGEYLPDERFEVLEGGGGVVGIEGNLIPRIGEALGQLIPGLVAILIAYVRILANVLVVMPPLEVLMCANDPVQIFSNIRTENLCRDRPVVCDRDGLSHGVAQRGDDELRVRPRALRPRRRLE